MICQSSCLLLHNSTLTDWDKAAAQVCRHRQNIAFTYEQSRFPLAVTPSLEVWQHPCKLHVSAFAPWLGTSGRPIIPGRSPTLLTEVQDSTAVSTAIGLSTTASADGRENPGFQRITRLYAVVAAAVRARRAAFWAGWWFCFLLRDSNGCQAGDDQKDLHVD